MTRFHTEYELKKQDKRLTDALLNDPESFNTELKDGINKDNHRAKKKAVSQYMDYDGFHQMVLVADLKGMKMVDVTEIKPDHVILNTVVEKAKLSEQTNDIFYRQFVPENLNKQQQKVMLENNSDKERLNINKFKLQWKKFTNVNDKINFLCDNIYSSDEFKQLINVKIIDADIFVDLIYVIGQFLNNNISVSTDKDNKIKFLFDCLMLLEGMDYFKKMKMFIGKKQKAEYETLFLKECIINNEKLNKIIKCILDK